MPPADLKSPQSQSPITHPKVLLVEGVDAFHFFEALLLQLDLLLEIEIRNFGGVDDMARYLEALAATAGFASVTSLGIVRDAETNAAFAFQAVRNSLRRVGLSVPARPMFIAEGNPQVSVFILPDCVNPGMLETLCLQALGPDPALPCVEDYFTCLERRGIAMPPNQAKAYLHAFLASRSKPDLLLGQAARAGYLYLDAPAFDQLKQFLGAL